MRLHDVAISILVGYHKLKKKKIFFFFWHYNPWWILASSTVVLCCSRSCDLCHWFLIFANPCSC